MKLYLIQRSGSGETFLKVGVTRKSDPNDRHYYGVTKVADADLPLQEKVKRMLIDRQQYMDEGPYPKIRAILHLEFEQESQALFLERSVIEYFVPIRYMPKQAFTGASECFIHSSENTDAIRAYLEAEHRKMTGFPFCAYYGLAAMKIRESDPIKRHLAIVAAMDK